MKQRGREKQVVDTNVVMVANRQHETSYACVNNCAQALLTIKKLGVIVIDDKGLILNEYRTNCSPHGQPGIGSAFVRWIYDNLGRTELVKRVAITPRTEPPRYFEEFPEHLELADFDPSDQKFVAVANARPLKPHILQALDSKWWGWKVALSECGITGTISLPG